MRVWPFWRGKKAARKLGKWTITHEPDAIVATSGSEVRRFSPRMTGTELATHLREK